MAIRAVVFDIGGVLEIIDDSIFPGPWPANLGLSEAEFAELLHPLAQSGAIGGITEQEMYDEWRRLLHIDDATVEAMAADLWRWYLGTIDRPLLDWFARQRGPRKTGILSNSGPGARERERPFGFEDITDDIVYSHEVGLAKPDPAVYALVGSRLGVEPQEIVFLDDVPDNITAAREAGWHAVHHVATPTSIAEMERILDAAGHG
jgi:putative hydrolase of the HAD superfamily